MVSKSRSFLAAWIFPFFGNGVKIAWEKTDFPQARCLRTEGF
jgi:hypothetical protein